MTIAFQFSRMFWCLPILVTLVMPALSNYAAPADEGRPPPESTPAEPADSDFREGQESNQPPPVVIIYNGKEIPLSRDGKAIGLEGTGLRLQIAPASRSNTEETSDSVRPTSQSETDESSVGDLKRSSPEDRPMTASDMTPWIILGGIVALGAVWFGIISPMRRRAPLVAALKILNQDAQHEFSNAEDLLGQSLLAGMRRRDIATARFALGFVRMRLSRFDEASVVLHELEKGDPRAVDGPVAYLMMRVFSQLGNHERAERVYNEYQEQLSDYEDVPLLVSISYLALARMHWARREINGAMHYFDQVRKLDLLSDEIPKHIDDHEVVVGTMSLFEDNHDEAVKHFNAAIEEANKNGKPDWAGKLGLLLCEWRQQETPDVDAKLSAIINDMKSNFDGEESGERRPAECSDCGKKYRIRPRYEGKRVKCRSCRKHFVVKFQEDLNDDVSGTEGSDERLLNEDEQIMRNVRLWHCVSLMFTWMQREPESSLPRKERQRLDERLEMVANLDPSFGDPQLIRSLIGYFFAKNTEERGESHQLMKKAIELGVNVPEVLQLAERENKWAELVKDRYMFLDQIIGQHLDSTRHDPAQSERLIRSLSRYERYSHLGDDVSDKPQQQAAPSVNDMRHRTDITRTRVSNYIARLAQELDDETRNDIQEKLDSLEDKTSLLADSVRNVEKLTTDVVIITAQEDLRDEELISDDANAGNEKGEEN